MVWIHPHVDLVLIVKHNNRETHHRQIHIVEQVMLQDMFSINILVLRSHTWTYILCLQCAWIHLQSDFCDVSQVRVAKSYISCPIPECSGFLEEGVVISHLANEDVAKYRYFLELSQLDSSTKPCPQCSQFSSLKGNNSNHSEHKYKVRWPFQYTPPTAYCITLTKHKEI